MYKIEEISEIVESLQKPELRDINRYTPGKPIEEVQRELGLERVIKLGSNENLFSPPQGVIEAISREAKQVNYYPDDAIYYLTRKLASKLNVSEEQITWGSGTVEIIRMFSLAFISPGDIAVVGAPSFGIYDYEFKLQGGEVVRVPLKEDYTYDLETMLKEVNDRKAKVVVLCSPNNPTGTIIREGELKDFLRGIKGDTIVILDEAYFELVTDPEYHDGVKLLKEYPLMIVMRTMSKAYGLAGLRVGYSISHPEIAKVLNKVRLPFNLSRIAQAAALAALDEEEFVKKYREAISKERERLAGELRGLGLKFIPTQTNFIAIEVGDDLKISEKLKRKGFIVRPGSQFSLPGFIRVTISPDPNINDEFLRALKGSLEGES